MPKISQFTTAAAPSLSDKLIGTSVSGSPTNQTNNFTLQEIKDLFDGGPTPPSPTLQSVLNAGNTAIQNIYLTGELEAIDLTIANDASSKNLYLAERFFDKNNSAGTNGQYLTSTGSGVQWSTLTIPIPTLQQVLTAGNVSDKDITTTGDIQADAIQGTNITANSNLRVVGTLADSTNSVGTSGQVLSSTVTGIDWVDLPSYSALSPLIYNNVSKQFSIQQATNTQNGYLSSADWITFDGKQNAGNYITALTGEASASGPGSVSITLNNLAVINKTLTGFTALSGTVTAADSIITAFGKLQNQVNSVTSGLSYQGVWNASTNTPALTSGVGLNGQYYVVDVAGSTNLDGITDWKVGDWAIFNGSSWQKIDNTDSVVSVNGQIGVVVLNSDNIAEGTTNLYYTDTKARNAISSLATGLTYTAGTGVFSLTVGYSIPTIANQTDWTTAYNNSIVSAAVTGTGTKTLTLTQQDGGTITANWTEPNLSGYVPYTGATAAVDLGYNALGASYLRVNGASPTSGSYLGFKQTTSVTTGAPDYTSIYAFGTNYLGVRLSQSPTSSRDFTFDASTITPDIPGGRIYSMPDANGTLALTSDIPSPSSFVPYTGATSNVNLGEYGLTTGFLGFDLTPTATPTTVGTMYWDTAYRTASLVAGVGTNTLQIGQEEVLLVHNNTGSALTNGQVVYVTGSTGELPSISLADASSESTSAATLGVVSESIANGADGFVTVSGIVHGINTLAYNEGDILWLSETAGQFTTVKPISPAHLVLIGYVIKKSGGNGSILVKIQNTQELEESSDVLISAPKLDGQGLFLQTVSGTQLWRNRSISDVLGYTPASPSDIKDGILTVEGTGVLGGSGTFSANQATNETISIVHGSVSRINALENISPAFGGSFDAVSIISSSAEGHITYVKTQTVTLPTPNDATIILSAGTGISGGGFFTTDQSVGETIVFSHADTSSQGSVDNIGGTVIQDVTLDDFGHVTGLASVNLDSRYIQSETDTLQSVTDRGNTTTNSITASAFIGDGSGLTNLPSSAASLQDVTDVGNSTTNSIGIGTTPAFNEILSVQSTTKASSPVPRMSSAEVSTFQSLYQPQSGQMIYNYETDRLLIGTYTSGFSTTPKWGDNKNYFVSVATPSLNVNSSFTLSWFSSTYYNIILVGNTTFNQTAFPGITRGNQIQIVMTGEYTPTFPSNWQLSPNSDSYDGTQKNLITAINYGYNSSTGTYLVYYTIENMDTAGGGGTVNENFEFTIDTLQLGSGPVFAFSNLLIVSGGTATINWGDGTITTTSGGYVVHNYASDGVYNISVNGHIADRLNSIGVNYGGAITNISNWGNFYILNNAFSFNFYMTITATDAPNFTQSGGDASGVFQGCNFIDPDVSSWDVSSVNNFNSMFLYCNLMNQSFDTWDISNGYTFTDFISFTNTSAANYSKTLISWAQQNVQTYTNFSTGPQYAYVADAARTTLISQYGWQITDNGPLPFI